KKTRRLSCIINKTTDCYNGSRFFIDTGLRIWITINILCKHYMFNIKLLCKPTVGSLIINTMNYTYMINEFISVFNTLDIYSRMFYNGEKMCEIKVQYMVSVLQENQEAVTKCHFSPLYEWMLQEQDDVNAFKIMELYEKYLNN